MSENREIALHQQIINSLAFVSVEDNFTLAAFRNLIRDKIKELKGRQGAYPLPLNHISVVHIYKLDLQISLYRVLENWLDQRIASIHLQTRPNSVYHGV